MANIIGEVSANHGNNIEGVEAAISELVDTGCRFVKFQLYTSESITIPLRDKRFLVGKGPWSGKYLVDLYSEGGLDYKLFKHAVKYSKKFEVTVFASVFDRAAADLCLELGISLVKIASAEIWDVELIAYCLDNFETVIVSLGMSSQEDVRRVYKLAAQANQQHKLVLMHCISGYPAAPTEYKLANIQFLKEHFGTNLGLSDHTVGEEVAVLASAMGVTWYEKHYIPSNVTDSLDAHFSADFEQMKRYVEALNRAEQIIGSVDFSPTNSEEASLKFRRGLFFNRAIKRGEIVSREDIISRRPSIGLKPYEISLVIGKQLRRDIDKYDAVLIEDFDEVL
jgi:pseudaminic acid synthase